MRRHLAYAIHMRVKSATRSGHQRQARTSAQLKAQVLELHERGMLRAAIADELGVSDDRALSAGSRRVS
jgi:hypothetical protein